MCIKLVALRMNLHQEVAVSFKKVGDPWYTLSAVNKHSAMNKNQGASLWGGHVPSTLDRRGHNIFSPPQRFVIKSIVVVQISWLHYCCKRFPSINQGIIEKNEHYHWIIC